MGSKEPSLKTSVLRSFSFSFGGHNHGVSFVLERFVLLGLLHLLDVLLVFVSTLFSEMKPELPRV